MKCADTRSILHELMDGESSPLEEDALRHADACAGCRRWYDTCQATGSLLELARYDVPERELSASVMAAIPERHPASRRGSWRVFGYLGGAWAAAGLLILGALVMGLQSPAVSRAETFAASLQGGFSAAQVAVVSSFNGSTGPVSSLGWTAAIVALQFLSLDLFLLGLVAALWKFGKRSGGAVCVCW